MKININSTLWNDLNEEEKKEVVAYLKSTGKLGEEDTLEGDPKVPDPDQTIDDKAEANVACEILYSIARKRCNKIKNPITKRLCKVAAAAAYAACKAHGG